MKKYKKIINLDKPIHEFDLGDWIEMWQRARYIYAVRECGGSPSRYARAFGVSRQAAAESLRLWREKFRGDNLRIEQTIEQTQT